MTAIGIQKNAGNKILKFFAKFCVIEAKLVKITKISKNAFLEYSLNVTVLHMQLDLVTRIPNLQSESKNVEN